MRRQAGIPHGRAAEQSLSAQQAHDEVLDVADLLGRRMVETGLMRHVTIPRRARLAALETMSRFAVNPQWLIYLPPTMSPVETSSEPDLPRASCRGVRLFPGQECRDGHGEEKHMGSRAIVVLCRDADAARRRFGVTDGSDGIIYTRTGRRFFDAPAEGEVLARLRAAMTMSGLWDELGTDWVCLDAEIMPWSAKAQELLRQQYAATGLPPPPTCPPP